MTIKDIIAYCLVIALGMILALHFAFFWIYGGVFIYESNKVILSIETGMSATILVFGIERLISAARSMNNTKASIVAAVASKKIQAQSPARIKPSLRPISQSDRAAIAATTTVSAMPLNTVLSTDSDARYQDNYSFDIVTCTEDHSEAFECFVGTKRSLQTPTESL